MPSYSATSVKANLRFLTERIPLSVFLSFLFQEPSAGLAMSFSRSDEDLSRLPLPSTSLSGRFEGPVVVLDALTLAGLGCVIRPNG